MTAKASAAPAAMLRGGALPTLVVGAAVAVAAAVAAGYAGLVGAVVGTALVVAFFGSGLLIARATARSSPAGVFVAATSTYVIKITFLALFLVVFRGTTLFDRRWLAAAALAGAGSWLAGEVRAFTRLRIPSVEPTDSG